MNKLLPYTAAFRAWFHTAMQYRVATLTSFIARLWFGLVYVEIFHALYSNKLIHEPPISVGQAVTYVWLQQALIRLQPVSCDPEVANSIRTGTIVYDRIRPVDTYTLWYARSLAKNLGPVLIIFVLIISFAGFILPLAGLGLWGMNPPESSTRYLLFIASAMLGILTATALAVLMDTLAAALLSPAGINAVAFTMVIFLSGSYIPLPLLPGIWATLSVLQPLASLIDIPSRIFTSSASSTAIPYLLAVQVFWLSALVVLGRQAMDRTMMRLQIQGG
ncbi:ABC transporter permease [Rhizobium rhizogenes]|uniref:ABC transporter permease n=1 Tax=Rhizobium rhizogenes TaxID=359 RepID=UPI0024BE3DFC|nr:ABC transporter permease [Rhizobium rhizogenes]MDJ1638743.1 ABC transporter permease [Rhizobium rhizogenes]